MFRPSGQHLKNYEGGGLRTVSFSFPPCVRRAKSTVRLGLLTLALAVWGNLPVFFLQAQEPVAPAASVSSPLPAPVSTPGAAAVTPPPPGTEAPAAPPPAQDQPAVPAAAASSEVSEVSQPAATEALQPAAASAKPAPAAVAPEPSPGIASDIVLPDSAAAAAEDEDPRRVRFTAWNLKNYLHVAAPPPEGSTEKSKSPRERAAIAAMLAQIHPDILGVCEMGSAADLAVFQAELKNAGLDLPQAEWVEGADPARHLALLTRFPIASRQPVTNLRYVLDDSQFPVQRGFLDVTVAVNANYTLRLVGTHLKSRLDTPEADQELMRRNEAHLLRQHIDTVLTAEPQANLLVYGDLNDTRDQPSVKAIKGMRGAAAALTEIPATDDSGERWTFYYPEADEYSRIDFLLASSALLPEVRRTRAFLPGGRGWSRASDHRPVTLDLIADDTASTSRAKSRPSRSRTKSKTPPPLPTLPPAAADSAPEN